MTEAIFLYQAFLRTDGSGRASSLIAYQVLDNSELRAVMWSVPRRAWIYAPGTAVGLLYSDEYHDRTRLVDRQTAERIATEEISTDLPTEEVLLAMCDEGQRMGWKFGPPRQ
jgi:hypothetical protein